MFVYLLISISFLMVDVYFLSFLCFVLVFLFVCFMIGVKVVKNFMDWGFCFCLVVCFWIFFIFGCSNDGECDEMNMFLVCVVVNVDLVDDVFV